MAIITPEGVKFRKWNINELYFGGPQIGTQYRPTIGDEVTDWDVGIYQVVSVDASAIPKLELKFRFPQATSLDIDSDSLITALSDYQPSVATPAFYNGLVSPAEIVIDRSFPIMETNATSMTFFKGRDTSPSGNVIKANVPLDNVDVTGNIKRPQVFKVTDTLQAGDVITGVVYGADGTVYAKPSFVVIESAAQRPLTQTDKVLIDISLDSPLIDPVDTTLLRNKLATPFETTLIKGKLHYDDGSTSIIDIDDIKMRLLGISDFGLNLSVMPTDVTLVYYPDVNEPYENASNAIKPFLSKDYRLANISFDPVFTLKLYPIPRWIDMTSGYEIEWRLTNLDYDIDVDVTSLVNVRREGGVTFEPLNYGAEQVLNITLDMDQLAPGTYQGYIFQERMTIIVDLPTSTSGSPWVIDWSTDGNNLYGGSIYASCGPGTGGIPSGNHNFKITNDTSTLDSFLHKCYHTIEPLYDIEALTEPAVPSHFRIEYEGVISEVYDLAANWDQEIPKPVGITVFEDNKTMTVTWLLDTGSGYATLGHSPMITKVDLI